MRVLLVDTNIFEVNPIPILDLAPYLRGTGIDVSVARFSDLPKNTSFDIVGLSCISSFSGKAIDQLRVLKTIYSNSKIIMGGKWTYNLSPQDIDCLTNSGVAIAYGPGEPYFTGCPVNFSTYPSWDLSDLRKLQYNNYMMSSRGCPFKCNFCNNTENNLSYFSAERTVSNIAMLLQLSPTVQFVDDIFSLNEKQMERILVECHQRGVPIEDKNSFFIHVNTINDSMIEMIKRFRPYKVFVGIESGDDRMLKEMGKGTSVSKIRNSLSIVSKHVSIEGLWLLGFPGETNESLENTMKVYKEFRPYLNTNWVSYYQPIYGTVGYAKAIEEGGTFKTSPSLAVIGYVPKNLTEETLSYYKSILSSI